VSLNRVCLVDFGVGRFQDAHLVHVVPRGLDEVLAVRLVSVSVVHNQIDRHLPFQAADVPMAEVITKLVDLEVSYGPGLNL